MWLTCCFGLIFLITHAPKLGGHDSAAAAHSAASKDQVRTLRHVGVHGASGGPRDAASAQRTGSQPEPGQRAEKVWAQVRNRPSAKQMMDIQPTNRRDGKHSSSRSRPHREEARIEDRAIHDGERQTRTGTLSW